jgi:hypothetical protein
MDDTPRRKRRRGHQQITMLPSEGVPNPDGAEAVLRWLMPRVEKEEEAASPPAAAEPETPLFVPEASSARYVTLERAAQLTGYTKQAMQTKISRGVWIQGRVWVRAPDNRVLIDMDGYNRWASGSEQR